mgnify:CR=1 FL=1
MRRACASTIVLAVMLWGCADTTARLDPVSHRAARLYGFDR